MEFMAIDDDCPFPPPLSIGDLPDDVLLYLADRFLDDRSLGMCLLAWRRFHVFDDPLVYRRKYHFATLLSLCAAGDEEGLDYALRHPDVFGSPGNEACWAEYIRAAQDMGRARMVWRLMRTVEPSYLFSLRQWSVLALDAALRGSADVELIWLCRTENRPKRWDDAALIYGCTRAITFGRAPSVVLAALDAIESLSGLSVGARRNVWERLSAHPTRPAIGVHSLLAIADMAQRLPLSGRTYDPTGPIKEGYTVFLKDLVGEKNLISLLRQHGGCMTSYAPDHDVDGMLWLYDHVDLGREQVQALSHLVTAAARSGRADFLDAAESRAAQFERKRGWSNAEVWTRAYASASRAGHANTVQRILVHQIDICSLKNAFESYRREEHGPLPARYDDPRTYPTYVWSPLVLHHGRQDLADILLDRRPRNDIPQADIDARVDHMVDITVEDALSKGNLSIVRRLYLVEPAVVNATVGRLRDRDRDPR